MTGLRDKTSHQLAHCSSTCTYLSKSYIFDFIRKNLMYIIFLYRLLDYTKNTKKDNVEMH